MIHAASANTKVFSGHSVHFRDVFVMISKHLVTQALDEEVIGLINDEKIFKEHMPKATANPPGASVGKFAKMFVHSNINDIKFQENTHEEIYAARLITACLYRIAHKKRELKAFNSSTTIGLGAIGHGADPQFDRTQDFVKFT